MPSSATKRGYGSDPTEGALYPFGSLIGVKVSPTSAATTEGKGNLSITSKPAAPSTDEIKAPPNPVSDIVGRIAQKMADKKDTSDDIQTLEDFDMEPMLEVLTRLRNIGYFEGFTRIRTAVCQSTPAARRRILHRR